MNGNADQRPIFDRTCHWALEYVLAVRSGLEDEAASRTATEISGFNAAYAHISAAAETARESRRLAGV